MNKLRGIIGVVSSLSIAVAIFMPVQAASAATVTAASAVRSVTATDNWSNFSPRTARVALKWAPPASLYGATLVGYKIEKSENNSTWSSAVLRTPSTSRSYTISTGLTVGQKTYFRVRAITKKGSTTKIGNASAVIAKVPTAVPMAPVLLGASKVNLTATGNHVVHWMQQNSFERGGLTTVYKATATGSGAEAVSCSANNAGMCTLKNLVSGTTYRISLTATNARGTKDNLDEFISNDADLGKQWYLNSSNGVSVTRAWTATRGSSKVVVAVLDSGITAQPELEGQLVSGYDFVSNAAKAGDGDGRDADPTDPGDSTLSADKQEWHGTHVAGIIAAKSDDIGISGIAPNVKIQPVRVLGPGGGDTKDLADAMLWAAGIHVDGVPDNATPAKVINLSLVADNGCSAYMQSIVNQVQAKGVIIVAAAGNGDDATHAPLDNRNMSPTGCSGPISVGASTYDGDHAFYSNYNVDLMAPGGDFTARGGDVSGAGGEIYSLWNPGYKAVSGTSMAAPVVSGIIALMFSIKPTATYEEIATAVINSTTPFKAGSVCAATPGYCGVGIVNAAKALEYLLYPLPVAKENTN